MSEKNSFHYTYSAEEQREIKEIRRKYGIEETDEEAEASVLEQLRQIDKSTTRPGMIVSWIDGVIGTLIMGTGMSLCMVGGEDLFLPGLAIGLLGIIFIMTAYPLYKAVTKRQKAKNVSKILKLGNKLLNQ